MVQSIVAVFLRLSGLYILLNLGWHLVYLFSKANEIKTAAQIMPMLNLTAIVVLALVLLCIPMKIAKLILIGIPTSSETTKLSFDDIQHLLFSAIGCFFVVLAVSNLVGITTIALRFENIGVFIPDVVKLAVGLWLLFGAKGLRGILRKFRTAGA